MSSLATQLAQNASLNSAILVDRSRRKPSESYLFSGREADQHDLESIYALGVNGLLQLATVEPLFRPYESRLFSDHAKATDRTLLTVEVDEGLDKSIEEFLGLLGPYLMENPAAKVIEWLVRRFRINEFNVDAVLSLFLPYHESPHFAKMVTILHIKQNSKWSFLRSYKSAAQKLPRVSLVTEILRNSEVARFVISLLPEALKEGRAHRVLLAFNAASLQEFITRSKDLDEGTVAHILSALLEPLQQKTHVMKDAILGSYILLSALSHKCQFAGSALKTIIASMAKCALSVTTKQFVSAAVAVCEPQDMLERFSRGTIKAILQLPDIKEELRVASAWFGSEKLILPIIKALGSSLEDETAFSLIETMIISPNIPSIITEETCSIILKQATTSDTSEQSTVIARQLLSVIHQRHPSLFHSVAEAMGQEDEDMKVTIDQFIMSITVTPAGVTSSDIPHIDMILASSNADGKVRAMAVKDLLSTMSSENVRNEDLDSICTALLARVHDTDSQVLDQLYGNPATLTKILSKDPGTYIEYLSQALTSVATKPKRSIIKIHLTYLALHLCPVLDPSLLEQALYKVFFPFLLFTKSRQRTTELVWDIIGQLLQGSTENLGKGFELLADCDSIIKSAPSAVGEDAVENMYNLNAALSSKIAHNISISGRFDSHFGALLRNLQHQNTHVKLFSYLIGRALLRLLTEERQVDGASKMLKAMNPLELHTGIDDLVIESGNIPFLNESALGKRVVAKPNKKATLLLLQTSVLVTIARIARPTGLTLDWFSSYNYSLPDSQDFRFVELMREVYNLANKAAAVPNLTQNILEALFISLGDDALAFLAGIWAGADEDSSNTLKDLPDVALRHGAAFLEAHLLEDDGVDFQTILPSLLVAIQKPNVQTRRGALECISRLRILSDRRFSSVYKFDIIYGQSERKLQYLDSEDLKRYLQALVEHSDHFTHDATFVGTFHQQHLRRNKSDKKRDSEYKHRILCFLLSHVNTIASNSSKSQILRSVGNISDKSKAHILEPTINDLSTSASEAKPDTIFKVYSEELTTLLLSCFDVSVTKSLNDSQSILWKSLILSMRGYFRSGISPTPQLVLSESLQNGLFAALNFERKIQICQLILEVGTTDTDEYTSCKQLLGNLLQDVPLMIHLLGTLVPPTNTETRATKRAKTLNVPDDKISSLTFLVEVLGTKSLPGSLDLISSLLETLNKVIQFAPSSQVDVSYIEQLLMSAVENCAVNITELPNIAPSTIRLDVLVEVIRISDNPQTFHQALLLIAKLAQLAPESVLHNIMPVFTFMGSNVFHRDDNYSFGVVQQTIDGIVPVMVSSLKQAHTNPLDLHIGGREFLRVFTDAANHIPRHRRNKFFSHLVGVLGFEQFMAPVCMLLIEKVANRVVRQNQNDIQTSLSLPIYILQQKPQHARLSAVTEILLEAKRLASRIVNPGDTQRTFLDDTTEGEHAVPPATALKRRAQALIIFVGFALKSAAPSSSDPQQDEMVTNIVAQLVSLASMQGDNSTDTKLEEVHLAARTSLNQLLNVMPALDFIKATHSMVQSKDLHVQEAAFNLLSQKLSQVSEKHRQTATPIITEIVGSANVFISSPKGGQLAICALQALRSIALTLCPGEEESIITILPAVLSAVNVPDLALSAVAALPPMVIKAGPRIIPYLRDLVTLCVSILHRGVKILSPNTFETLQALLTSIPTFWGNSEISQVIKLYIDHSVKAHSPSSEMTQLMKSVTKRTLAKALLETLITSWPSLELSIKKERIPAYFNVLIRALRNSPRPPIQENLRALFDVFLQSLNIVKASNSKMVDPGETAVLAAFNELVVKLNETSFRPLFRRLYDWAFASDLDDIDRKATFCHLYIGLLDFFKALMNPYMSFLLQPCVDILNQIKENLSEENVIWTCVIEILTKSLNFDDGAFWRDDKLRQIASPLVSQIPVCVRWNQVDKDKQLLLQSCIGALVDSTSDDTLLKSINLEVLLHTRSEDAKVRLSALSCSESLWRTHGGKLLGFAAETSTFIAECSEDDNDMIIKECFKLKYAVENVAGKIDGL